MNAIDLIGNFIIGGVIGCALFSPTITFMTYLVALLLSVIVLGTLNYLYLHVDFFHRITSGNPIPVIRDGIFCFNEVAYAQLEPNGALTNMPIMVSAIFVWMGMFFLRLPLLKIFSCRRKNLNHPRNYALGGFRLIPNLNETAVAPVMAANIAHADEMDMSTSEKAVKVSDTVAWISKKMTEADIAQQEEQQIGACALVMDVHSAQGQPGGAQPLVIQAQHGQYRVVSADSVWKLAQNEAVQAHIQIGSYQAQWNMTPLAPVAMGTPITQDDLNKLLTALNQNQDGKITYNFSAPQASTFQNQAAPAQAGAPQVLQIQTNGISKVVDSFQSCIGS
ncbi:membrane protein [Lasius niger]|uniref:Membrane protein n=1 Tax=Lasius niger TaxID=67767 RepID=A0A0J7NME4_LASNI|nr:membrane protein [Lasius niger]